jgi:hypothetical protein
MRVPSGGVIPVQIVKPLYGDGFFVYRSAPGLKAAGIRPSAAQIDAVRDWQPF